MISIYVEHGTSYIIQQKLNVFNKQMYYVTIKNSSQQKLNTLLCIYGSVTSKFKNIATEIRAALQKEQLCLTFNFSPTTSKSKKELQSLQTLLCTLSRHRKDNIALINTINFSVLSSGNK